MDDPTLVFVCGLHRSGTTQLAATLATHPQIAGMTDTGAPHDEGQHLQDVYPTARAYGGPGRFAFDRRAHLLETSALATPGNADRLLAQWSVHWDTTRPVRVEKSPPNLVRMRFLQALFPDARFVVIVRHPVVTALATTKLATGRWRRAVGRAVAPADTARHWFAAHRILLADLPHVHRVHRLRWEDLVADPGGALAALAAFVGVDERFDVPAFDAGVDERYARAWSDLDAVDGPEVRRLRAVLEDGAGVAAAFGYRADDPTVLGPLPVAPPSASQAGTA